MACSAGRDVAAVVLARLMQELGDDLVGLFATGSRVHGDFDEGSDLDLDAIVSTPRRQRRTWVVRGMEVEILLGPRGEVVRSLERDRVSGRGVFQGMWATGIVVYDPKGVVRGLKDAAARQWAAGPPPVRPESVWKYRSYPANRLADAERLMAVDEAQASYVLCDLVVRMHEAHRRLHGQWGHAKSKRALDDMAKWDPVGADLFRRASVGTAAQRYAAARELAEYSLRNVGGPMRRGEWETSWERVAL